MLSVALRPRHTSTSVEIVFSTKSQAKSPFRLRTDEFRLQVEIVFLRKSQAKTTFSTFRVTQFKILNAKRVAEVETAIPPETSSKKRFRPKSKISGSKSKRRFRLRLPPKQKSKPFRSKVEMAIPLKTSSKTQFEALSIDSRNGDSVQDFLVITSQTLFGSRSKWQFRKGLPPNATSKSFRSEVGVANPPRASSKTHGQPFSVRSRTGNSG